ncbi:MAG: ATP-binding protein [Ferrovibrionaceae bacterium]
MSAAPPDPDLLRPGLGGPGALLDHLGIAAAFIDDAERLGGWNATYLDFFPEHRGEARVGEHYVDNLRRYFRHNSTVATVDDLELIVAEALQRHRTQAASSVFQRLDGRQLVSRIRRFADGSCLKTWQDQTDSGSRQPLDGGRSGVSHYDARGIFVRASQRVGDLFPGLAEAIRANPDYASHARIVADFLLDPEDAAAVRRLAERPWPIVDVLAEPMIVRRRDGRWLVIEESRRFDGGLAISSTDITDYRQLEDRLRHEREMALLQRGFVSMASHQFRTPLAIIDANAQLLMPRGTMVAPPAEQRQRLDRIRSTVSRMVQLIEVMLGAASAEAGVIALKPAPCALARLVEDACERVRELHPARSFTVALQGLPDMVDCDAALIDQVIGNLLSNAVKYSPRHLPVAVAGRADGDHVEIAVTDQGVGIAAEDQDQIFDRFFRARNVGGIAGTGIGLTLARYIAELHGGTLTVTSALGAGSTFTLRLPATASS